MSSRVYVAITAALLLGGCDGFTFGNAVVGPLPEPYQGPGDMLCGDIDACAAYLPEEPERWTPPVDPLVGAGCGELVQYALTGDAALHPMAMIEGLLTEPQTGEGPLELRCIEIAIEVPETSSSFELDLRAATLEGVRISIHSEVPGRVLLGTVGAVSASEFVLRGPLDIVADRAVVWGARIEMLPSRSLAPAGSLMALETQFRQLEVAGSGSVAMRRSSLNEALVHANVLRSELCPWATTTVVASSVEVFEANLWQVHVETEHFIAAAGAIRFSEFVECNEIILAAVTVNQTRFGLTDVPILLSSAMILNSYVEADLTGSARVVQSALLSHSIDFEGGAIANSSLCGVDILAIAVGDATCLRCDAGAPADVCVSEHEEPLCPGFETASCSRGPRAQINRTGI
jgi:hypothetical protein